MMSDGACHQSGHPSLVASRCCILALLVSLALPSCGDDPGKIINKGGTLYPDKIYDFKLMVIEEIRASEKASFCNIRPRGQDKFWPDLTYEGDLSDFKNGDVVDVKIRGVEILSVTDAWFTTDFVYKFASPILGHRPSVVFAKYLFHGLLIVLVLFKVLEMIGASGQSGEKPTNS